MKRETYHQHADRYHFDFGMCSAKNGYCQIDTYQDASYYGQWTNPHKRDIIKYMEGDVFIDTAESDEEYVKAIRNLAEWNEKYGEGLKIDCFTQPKEKAKLEELGLSDLLH